MKPPTPTITWFMASVEPVPIEKLKDRASRR